MNTTPGGREILCDPDGAGPLPRGPHRPTAARQEGSRDGTGTVPIRVGGFAMKELLASPGEMARRR
jgi:hypothetical protein